MFMAGNALAGDTKPALAETTSWLLLLNNDLETAIVDRMAASTYDMVVIDHVSSQPGMPASRSADVVSRLRAKADGSRRLVIAYVNVGQAESYRHYWVKGWKIGHPAWILGSDPDGWQDNYPVAYWSGAWKAIITGENGLLADIQRAGFDGVYLDWIGGFEDQNVIAAARRGGVDPRTEMIRWVREVSADAKGRDPSFLVIAQNAAPLLEDRNYLKAIDAVAHEDIWFTGADSGPEGDCAVPRSQSDVGSPAFVASLTPACQRAYKRDRATAMHFAGEEAIVPMLQSAVDAGKTVLTVDYALRPENVETVRSRSRGFGFVPFVGARSLKAYVPPEQVRN
jgi:cysteinyl-tRNA synthetase